MCVCVSVCVFVTHMIIHKYLKMNFLYVFRVVFFAHKVHTFSSFSSVFILLSFQINICVNKLTIFFSFHNNLLYVSLQVEQAKALFLLFSLSFVLSFFLVYKLLRINVSSFYFSIGLKDTKVGEEEAKEKKKEETKVSVEGFSSEGNCRPFVLKCL